MMYLCLKRDIPNGRYLVVDVGAHSIVVKNESDNFTAALNMCEHRGFKVCQGVGFSDNIHCPYHGRKFDFKRTFKLHFRNEAIFIGEKETQTEFPELGPEFGSYLMRVKAPASMWMQNTADPNHLATVHKNTFNDIFESHIPFDEKFEEYGSEYKLKVKDGIVESYRKYGAKNETFTHTLIYPYLSLTNFLGIFFSVETANWIPRDGESEIKTRFFLEPDSKVPHLLQKAAKENNLNILDEDKYIVERWADSYMNKEVPWMDGEKRIQHYITYGEKK